MSRNQYLPSLTSEQRQIIDGCILGDGYISKPNTHSGLHSCLFKKQRSAARDALEWLSSKLNPYSQGIHDNKEPRPFILSKEKILPRSLFYTKQHPVFDEYRRLWYPNGKKVVPIELSLTPLSIAVWYMDDGSNAPGFEHAFLLTNGFSNNECLFLCDQLQRRFGIGCAIKPSTEGQPVIRISRRWYASFIELVRPYFQYPSMKYKVSMDPHEYARMRSAELIVGANGTKFYADGRVVRRPGKRLYGPRHVVCRGERNGHSKITEYNVKDILARAASGDHPKNIAASYKLSAWTVYDIIRGRSWKHVDRKKS